MRYIRVGVIVKDARTLNVWQRSHVLTLQVYKATESFPREELFGLTSQLRRSCASIPANISEGCGREGDADFARFVQIAMGSACETEYHLLLAHDLHYIQDADYLTLDTEIREIKQMLASFLKRLRSNLKS